jgi:hypothetical protein
MKKLIRSILRPSCVIAATLVIAVNANAQFKSPVGTWDFVISGGGQQGIAILTFSEEDFTFFGYEMTTSTLKGSSSNPRGGSGRTPVGTNSLSSETNLFGFSPVSGQWFYDSKGRVVGNYSIEVGISNNIQGVSFVGKVVPGKRLTLVASSPYGKLNYKGVPFRTVTDISGYWNGSKVQGKQNFIEFFTLLPADSNIYHVVDGIGPAYSFSAGFCMVSSQKKIGFTVLEVPEGSTNAVLRATVGSFSAKATSAKAKTKGIIESETKANIKFNAAKTTYLP